MAERISAAGHADRPGEVLVRFTWRQILLLLRLIGRRRRRDRALELSDTAAAIAGALTKDGSRALNERLRKLEAD